MFRVDMSGFKAKGDVATLIGAPKGYQDSVRVSLMPAAGASQGLIEFTTGVVQATKTVGGDRVAERRWDTHDLYAGA